MNYSKLANYYKYSDLLDKEDLAPCGWWRVEGGWRKPWEGRKAEIKIYLISVLLYSREVGRFKIQYCFLIEIASAWINLTKTKIWPNIVGFLMKYFLTVKDYKSD